MPGNLCASESSVAGGERQIRGPGGGCSCRRRLNYLWPQCAHKPNETLMLQAVHVVGEDLEGLQQPVLSFSLGFKRPL